MSKFEIVELLESSQSLKHNTEVIIINNSKLTNIYYITKPSGEFGILIEILTPSSTSFAKTFSLIMFKMVSSDLTWL